MAPPRRHPHRAFPPALEDRPFGPFGDLNTPTATNNPVTGPLVDAGVLEEAVLYRALFRVSDGRITPRDADHFTFWEAAVLLGVPTPEFPPDKKDRHGRPSASPASERAGELNRQRLAHAQGQGPAPEARPVDGATLNQVTGALR